MFVAITGSHSTQADPANDRSIILGFVGERFFCPGKIGDGCGGRRRCAGSLEERSASRFRFLLHGISFGRNGGKEAAGSLVGPSKPWEGDAPSEPHLLRVCPKTEMRKRQKIHCYPEPTG